MVRTAASLLRRNIAQARAYRDNSGLQRNLTSWNLERCNHDAAQLFARLEVVCIPQRPLWRRPGHGGHLQPRADAQHVVVLGVAQQMHCMQYDCTQALPLLLARVVNNGAHTEGVMVQIRQVHARKAGSVLDLSRWGGKERLFGAPVHLLGHHLGAYVHLCGNDGGRFTPTCAPL